MQGTGLQNPSFLLLPFPCRGYFYDKLEPAMVVNDGDTFEVEIPTMLGGNASECPCPCMLAIAAFACSSPNYMPAPAGAAAATSARQETCTPQRRIRRSACEYAHPSLIPCTPCVLPLTEEWMIEGDPIMEELYAWIDGEGELGPKSHPISHGTAGAMHGTLPPYHQSSSCSPTGPRVPLVPPTLHASLSNKCQPAHAFPATRPCPEPPAQLIAPPLPHHPPRPSLCAAGPAVKQHGPYGNSGGHIMTGPVYVCGAEPGDVIQVRRGLVRIGS